MFSVQPILKWKFQVLASWACQSTFINKKILCPLLGSFRKSALNIVSLVQTGVGGLLFK